VSIVTVPQLSDCALHWVQVGVNAISSLQIKEKNVEIPKKENAQKQAKRVLNIGIVKKPRE
jgi:hypothetical protein